MRTLSLALSLCGFLMVGSLACAAQGRKFPTPPEPADRTFNRQKAQESAPRPRVDFVEMQRESRELSDLAHTVPTDMENVTRGLMPKDLIEKLKRIEKLSKHLRSEVSP
jgi:hypothetical protein